MGRRFLLLQGPHGPFFASLATSLRRAGAKVWRVGFNAADRAFWPTDGYLSFREHVDQFEDWLTNVLETHEITDVVIYGTFRPAHQTACKLARDRGLTLHCLEEGYLRPYWVTYERGGTNAASRSMTIPLEDMEASGPHGRLSEPPDRWGDMWQHMFWGALYHAILLFGAHRYPQHRPHREPGVRREVWLYGKSLALGPLRIAARAIATTRIRLSGYPYHIVLLQLAHDANFREHGPFGSQADFLEVVFAGFAEGAPKHHHLVLKAHPLEDGREPLHPLIRRLTKLHGLSGRVHFVSGGKLARLLRTAKSAVTVNSTSAEQALWRGLPVRAFGSAVYRRDGLTSEQPITQFFGDPVPPNIEAYHTYRAFQMATSQVAGGYYAFRNRAKLTRQLPDLMLADADPYTRVLSKPDTEARRQQLRVVS